MSTDQMTIKPITITPPPLLQRRSSGIVERLRLRKLKATIFVKALEFAYSIRLVPMKNSKARQVSVKVQFGISTRDARLAIRDAKPKKHRRRS